MKNFINSCWQYFLVFFLVLNIVSCGKKSDPEYPENYIDYRYDSIKEQGK